MESETERPLILIVEDEYLLQADVVDVLTNGGFETEAVFSGEEALALFASRSRPYKMLITDVRTGGELTGWELARRIREKDAAFPVIYLTASAVEEWNSQGVSNSILMAKPFASAQLIKTLSTLLKRSI
jgi:DNA-binding response OmpR family regulator